MRTTASVTARVVEGVSRTASTKIARRKNMAVRNVRRVSINIPRMPKNVSITDDHGNVLHRPGDQAARMTMPSNAIRESPTEPK